MGLAQCDPVLLAEVAVVVQLGPVMHHERIVLAVRRHGRAGTVEQGLGQGGQGGAGVGEEAPGGLGAREGARLPRQGTQPGGHAGGGGEVLLDQVEITLLETFFNVGDKRYIHLIIVHLCRYHRLTPWATFYRPSGANPTAGRAPNTIGMSVYLPVLFTPQECPIASEIRFPRASGSVIPAE